MSIAPVDLRINAYIDGLGQVRHPLLPEMERLAGRRDFPIIGPQVGMLLHLLVKISGAQSVLELGSGFGYSALWMALALPEQGRIVCTDASAERRDEALEFFERAGLKHKLEFLLGNALELIDRMDGPFDLAFNDVDKEQYPATIAKVLPKLRPGGLFVTDNALWYGKVMSPEAPDAATAGVIEFNRLLHAHPQFDATILPVRDGVALARKRLK